MRLCAWGEVVELGLKEKLRPQISEDSPKGIREIQLFISK